MNDENEQQPASNPLNQQFWMREHFPGADYSMQLLAEKLQGIDALARLLANNDRLQEDVANDPGSAFMQPLNGNLTGGLFSALTALTSSAHGSIWGMVERSDKARREGQPEEVIA